MIEKNLPYRVGEKSFATIREAKDEQIKQDIWALFQRNIPENAEGLIELINRANDIIKTVKAKKRKEG